MTEALTTEHLLEEARVELLTDVQLAAELFAPLWPLTGFVAVNPLGGVQHRSFDTAVGLARTWLGARTHVDLEVYRDLHRQRRISDAALRQAARAVVPALDGLGRIHLGKVRVAAIDLVLLDLLHGPHAPPPALPPTAGGRCTPPIDDTIATAIDEVAATWCAAVATGSGAAWRLPARGAGLPVAGSVLAGDRRVRDLVGRDGLRWLASLPDDPGEALEVALAELGVTRANWQAEFRAQFARLPGWTGYARWCDTWMSEDDPSPRLHLLDLLTLRTVIEAAVVRDAGLVPPVAVDAAGAAPAGPSACSDPAPSRVDAVLAALGVGSNDERWTAVRNVLVHVPETVRATVWLTAREADVRDRLLLGLSAASAAPVAPAAPSAAPSAAGVGVADAGPPDAQLLWCIDVRSEGLRRNLEAQGSYETYGVAGFFGIPAAWRPLGSDRAEPRVPVLVTPAREVGERPALGGEPSAARHLGQARLRAGLRSAVHAAKSGNGSPYAYAESAGWLLGATAALRTLVPPRRPRPVSRRPGALGSVPDLHAASGFTLEERITLAGGLLRTVGLTDGFAPLVVLCGHGSYTVNNPHASSLDCGACGGAPGGASARIAAAILNDPEVRAGLAAAGIEVPATTWFVAAEHDTASDQVAILDRGSIPARLADRVAALEQDLEAAGERRAAERARRLPGDPTRVRARGRDWAEVRPEWGLARNAAFIVGPRSMTRERDLGGRAFLHSYDAEADPDGAILTGILTAPLVVAQWISAQYYFSTVDPEVFGAGDKLLHNPVGSVGVTLGDGGDLQVGLPHQSVAVGDRAEHEPLRLLAVVQAPRDRVASIIQAHGVLRELVGGRWIHVVVRDADGQPWYLLEADGSWTSWRAQSAAAVVGSAASPSVTPADDRAA
jgi:uncharacterized protein